MTTTPTQEQVEAAKLAVREISPWYKDPEGSPYEYLDATRTEKLATIFAQREQSSYYRGVRDGLEKAAKKAVEMKESMGYQAPMLTGSARSAVYAEQGAAARLEFEIRALMGDE